MTSFAGQFSAASVTVGGVAYLLGEYPSPLIDQIVERVGKDVPAIVALIEELGFTPDGPDDELPPSLEDWPAGYVDDLRERESRESLGEDEMLELLCEEHAEMRFGQWIDLNLQQGFYIDAGDGQITITPGVDCGHLIEVVDRPLISITRSGDMMWEASAFADEYVDRAADKMAWVFNKTRGPWILTVEYHERRCDDFYFLVAQFLSAGDDAAFLAAFAEKGA